MDHKIRSPNPDQGLTKGFLEEVISKLGNEQWQIQRGNASDESCSRQIYKCVCENSEVSRNVARLWNSALCLLW